ncbi:MAG: phosphate ABC transporter substrate-binding protein [Chloroflexota bacterium]
MEKLRFIPCILLLIGLLSACTSAGSMAEIPQQTLQNIGSDTIVNLALAWAEAYQQESSQVNISVTGGGSGAGLAALVNGTADIANASRPIKQEEIAQAAEKGFEPYEIIIARDAIAVVVHPDNPIERLTIQQVSDIYSGKVNNWAEVGGENRPIVRLSRETNSGTHVYFLETVVRLDEKGNETLFATDTLLMPSSEGINMEVRQNPNAIGYDGLGYLTPELKVIALSAGEDGPYVMPSIATVNDGTYPVARDLYMYTAGEPAGAIREFLDYVLSTAGQEIVSEQGFVPVTSP